MSDYNTFKARWVMGSPFDLRKTDHENKPLEEDKYHWFIGFAVPKGADWDALYTHMWSVAASDPTCGQALCGQAGFNWKFEDADAPENPKNLGSDSYPAGHMIIKFSRNVKMGVTPIFDGNYSPIVNPQSVKRGDWFYVSASTKFNGAQTVKTNAGMYQNINGLMFAEAGDAIVGAQFNAQSAFAGVKGGVVQQPSSAAPAPVTQQSPQAATPPPVTQQAPITPAHDLVQPGANVTPPPALPATPPPAPAEPSYNVNGTVYTKSQLVAANYTEAHFATMTPVA